MGASYSQSALAYIKALLLQSIKTHDSVLNCLAQEASVPHCEYIERNIENVFTQVTNLIFISLCFYLLSFAPFANNANSQAETWQLI